MNEPNEIVVVEMERLTRLKLAGQIASRMEAMGLTAGEFGKLDLGFEIPPGWPVDKSCHPTLAHLVVLARKLGMRIVISSIDMEAIKEVETL